MTVDELKYCIDNSRYKDGPFKGAINDTLFIQVVIDLVIQNE